MRLWAKKLMDHQCPEKKDMTKKDKFLVTFSVIVDSAIIGLLIYTLMANSCQICYQTGFGQDTFTRCSNVADVMEDGLPQEYIDIYEGKTQKEIINNSISEGLGSLEDVERVDVNAIGVR